MNTFSKENDPPVKTTNQATDKLPSVALETSDENTTAHFNVSSRSWRLGVTTHRATDAQ
jgi:hypothetical protein